MCRLLYNNLCVAYNLIYGSFLSSNLFPEATSASASTRVYFAWARTHQFLRTRLGCYYFLFFFFTLHSLVPVRCLHKYFEWCGKRTCFIDVCFTVTYQRDDSWISLIILCFWCVIRILKFSDSSTNFLDYISGLSNFVIRGFDGGLTTDQVKLSTFISCIT